MLREQLEEQQILLETIFNSTSDLLVLKDRKSVYQRVNSAFCKFLCKQENEIIGKTDFDLFPPAEAEMYRNDDARVMESGKPQVQDEEVTGKEGSRWLQVAKTPVLNKEGATIGVLCSVCDITKHKKAEEELQKAKDELEKRVKERTAELESAVELLHDEIYDRKKVEEEIRVNAIRLRNAQRVGHIGFWDWNIITGDLYWSDETCRIFGFQPQEFVPTFDKFQSILFPDDRERVLQKVEAALNNIEPYNIDFRFIYPDGNVGWIHVVGEVDRNEKGEPIRFFGTQIDVTKSKQAESELIKAKEEIEAWSKELEKRVNEKTEELIKSQAQLIQSEKLSAMGQMAGGLAHELNSPLAGLLPMIEKYRDEEERDSEAYNELSLMLKACDHMAKIVRDFSSFSRESKGEFTDLSINEVIEDTLSFSASRIKQKGLQLIKEYDRNLPNIHGEKTGLQQVILNIITNAFDAIDAGGLLTIKTGIAGNKNVKVEFIDNGAGINNEILEKIFDPFYTTKRPGKGTGLGLSVSYKIIEKHGGTILVKSEPGKGSKFTILLPVAKWNYSPVSDLSS